MDGERVPRQDAIQGFIHARDMRIPESCTFQAEEGRICEIQKGKLVLIRIDGHVRNNNHCG
jgi:hypothetical protein